MSERSAVTVIPLLAGLLPGVTATVSSVVPPTVTDAGSAVPVPVGLVSAEHAFTREAVFRGMGAPAAKSAELLSVSVQPLPARSAAVVLLRTGAGAVSEQLADPKPMRSTIAADAGQAPESAVVTLTSATLPFVALIGIVPVASGAGRLTVPPAPWASWTR